MLQAKSRSVGARLAVSTSAGFIFSVILRRRWWKGLTHSVPSHKVPWQKFRVKSWWWGQRVVSPLVKRLSNTHKDPGSIPSTAQMWCSAHICHSSTWEVEARRYEVQGHPKIYRNFKGNLDDLKPYFKGCGQLNKNSYWYLGIWFLLLYFFLCI